MLVARSSRDEGRCGKELMLCNKLQILFAGGALIDELTNLVMRAAAAISAVDKENLQVSIKSDLSPVPAADEAANRVIASGLRSLLLDLRIVSEEDSERADICSLGKCYLLIDPLDDARIHGRTR